MGKNMNKIEKLIDERGNMANERKTEIITRDHFSKFLDSIYIEEQRSDNPKIDKLLKSASKKGGGKGYPEFINRCHFQQAIT